MGEGPYSRGMRLFVAAALVSFSAAACTAATDPTTTTLAATTTTQAAATTSTPASTTTTTMATTTTAPIPMLPEDVCEQLDVIAIQGVLGVDSVRAGSPFGTSSDGAGATCRFAVRYDGNFGSAFNVVMRAPGEGAFDDLISGLTAGEGSDFPGLGNRAMLFVTESGSRLLVVEFANASAAYAVADNDDIYAGSPEDALAEILGDIVGSVLLPLS